jgi:hypothetical protein
MPTPNEPDLEAPDSPEDHEPDTVGTPEGDNEFPPDAPLRPLPDGAELDPRGAAPDEYRQPK